jgi:hypothetical protein
VTQDPSQDVAAQPEDDEPEALAGAPLPASLDGVAEPALPVAEFDDEDEQS